MLCTIIVILTLSLKHAALALTPEQTAFVHRPFLTVRKPSLPCREHSSHICTQFGLADRDYSLTTIYFFCGSILLLSICQQFGFLHLKLRSNSKSFVIL